MTEEGQAAMGAGSVRAQVRTNDGWPVQHAVLTVTDLTGKQVDRVVADADGALASGPLPAGSYTAIVTAPGHAPAARAAVVTDSGAVSLGVVALARLGGERLPAPGPWTIDPAHSSIWLIARHLGLSSIRGRFGEFTGRIEVAQPIERSTVHAVIKGASIDTNNRMRDQHLRSADFLDVEQHPTIEFRGFSMSPVGEDSWKLDGELTVRGMTRPVQLDMTHLGVGPDPWGGTRAAFAATTELHREDFGVTYNQVLEAGIDAIGATVRVELDIQAVQGETLPW
jgi:polyisoprenoid-binding protein YceI